MMLSRLCQFQYSFLLVWALNRVNGQSTSSGGTSYANCGETFAESVLRELRLVRQTLSSENKEINPLAKVPDCPSNFTYLSESNKCYRLETDRLEWEVARMRCNHLHPRSHPVIVDDHNENRIITALVKSRWEVIFRHCWSKQSGGMMVIWTAGQRVDPSKKSTFVWKPEPNPSSWSEMKYTAWNAGEPNDHGGQESCSHLAWLSNEAISWNDAPCGIHSTGLLPDFGFQCVLCEIDMK